MRLSSTSSEIEWVIFNYMYVRIIFFSPPPPWIEPECLNNQSGSIRYRVRQCSSTGVPQNSRVPLKALGVLWVNGKIRTLTPDIDKLGNNKQAKQSHSFFLNIFFVSFFFIFNYIHLYNTNSKYFIWNIYLFVWINANLYLI